MIQYIEDMQIDRPDLYGERILWLKKLGDANLKVADTIVVSNELFLQYMQEKIMDDNAIISILTLLKRHNNHSRIYIKNSMSKYCLGILDNLIVEATFISIKLKIEELFRSWYDTPARAYRITHSIDNADTYPALIIQPYYPTIFSLVTRSPRDGFPTNQSNIKNIHNTVEKLGLHHISMLEKTEATLGFPAKVYFVESETEIERLSICSVKPELMTSDAYWNSFNDLYRKGYINERQLLFSVKPDMIASVSGYEAEIDNKSISNDDYVQLAGMPVSAGRAVGELTFITTETFEKKDRQILFVDYFSPGDLSCLVNAIGAFSNEGGATSHLAVVSKHLAIPAVVGIPGIKFDLSNRQIQIGSQYFNEGSWVFIDGILGDVRISRFSLDVTLVPRYRYGTQIDNMKRMYRLLKKFTSDSSVFEELPLEFQTHLSMLTQRFNQIEFDKLV